jgi:hypothetical protein
MGNRLGNPTFNEASRLPVSNRRSFSAEPFSVVPQALA